MYNLQGFVAVGSMANPSPTAVANIGEISTRSLTYARGVGEYASGTLPYRLYSFYSQTESGQIVVPQDLFTQLQSIVDWAFTKQKSGSPATSPAAFIAALQTQFGSGVTAVGCGALVDAGTFLFPEYITWVNPNTITNDPTVGSDVKIWFSDRSFQAQYAKYEIIVVPPVSAIDNLMNGYEAAKAAIEAMDLQATLNALQTARGDYPETLVVPMTYDYVDPADSTNQLTTTWSLLVYGASGNNPDYIRVAIQDYIASNSQYPVSNWRRVLPGLYTSTEFLIFPRWMDYAIAEMVHTEGAYSAIVNPAKQLAYLKAILTDHPDTYIDEHTSILPTNYKSVMLVVVPGAENAATQRDIFNIFDDLMNVPTTDPLFNEMRAKTRSWVTSMVAVLKVAETATVLTSLPAGMSTVVRNNVLFIAQSYSGVTYLVAAKSTIPDYE